MRFSLTTMLVITAYAALGSMALAAPAFHWTSLLWNVSLIVLALAAIGALATKGRDRAYWTGFATCGWVHYLFTLGPPAEGRINAYIFSRPALDFLCVTMNHTRTVHVFDYERFLSTQPSLNFFLGGEKERIYIYFMLSGFCLFSVISGVLGGWSANYLFASIHGSSAADSSQNLSPPPDEPPG